MHRYVPIGVVGIFLAGLTTYAALGQAKSGPKHPNLHHALNELREANQELKGAAHDFGGHRVKATKDIHQAIDAIEDALRAAGDPYKGKIHRDANDYKKYKHHPHIHHALHDLHEAERELQNANHNFGGKREKALSEVNQAIHQLNLVLKHAK